ncbi:MAG: hypothetical protein ABIQ12_14910 [Opitutaceae bacterium]
MPATLPAMQALLIKFAGWLGQKLVAALLIVLLALAGYGLWLFLQDEGLLDTKRVEKLRQAITERDQLLTIKAEIEKRVAGVRTAVRVQQERAQEAEKVISALRALQSWWERWFGNRQQQAANAEHLRRMEALKVEAETKLGPLRRSLTQIVWELEGADHALRLANHEVALLEATKSKTRHYLIVAWDQTKWYLALALASFFFGPTLWALTLYYGVAPVMARGRAIRLGPDPAALPEVGASHVSIEATLQPRELMRIREKFLQASDEGVEKRTRFVLDWRIPLTSVACGLIELVELKNARESGVYRITLSNGVDPHIELAEVTVPAGSSLVLRPSFLAGVIQREGERLVIRRHWRIFHWQAWISGQFRFFEFVGPCRLMVAGSRGVRAECLADRDGQPAPARRTNQDATIGFTPNLAYRPVRAETFWSYYRGMNPLFDDLFSGRGLFVLQETAGEGAAARAANFWATVWNGVLKVFGL